ncbi:MAG: helix-turn-helix domain-containing protein [Eubacterium sp.]|nr:helix-turn-helix domain-containing protein [Eubacterium sp.]
MNRTIWQLIKPIKITKEDKLRDNKKDKALLNVKEMCNYLGIGQTKARELLSNPRNNFTIRIGNRLYAHKGKLDEWLLNQIM